MHDLEDLLDKVSNGSRANEKEKEERMLVKYEFEQLLKYKQEQLKNGSNKVDLTLVKRDVEDIQTQVSTLEDFLNTEIKNWLN